MTGVFAGGRFGWGRWGLVRGNPYAFCRWFPWRPRWWWAHGPGPYRVGAGYPGPYPAGVRSPYYRPATRYRW
jgi:hypothetical protein